MDFIHKISAAVASPPAQWIAVANDRLPGIFSVVLVIAIAWTIARSVWMLVPLQSDFDWSVRPPASSGSPSSGNAGSAVNFASIVNAHLFGEAGAEPVAQAAAIDAPDTRLNLKLRGAIAASEGEEEMAHAIIADGNGKDAVYFINDSLPGGATLHEVYPDRVILNRAGALETLRLPRLSEALGKQTAPPPPETARTTPSSGTIRQLMQENSGSFTDVLRPQPYMPNGELKGYRVYPGRDRRRFAALGLRPGDLVTDINGQPLNNLQSGMEIFRNLGEASEVSVTIERDGSPVSLTLDTSQLVEEAGNEE